jgi:hypothetical protein
VKSSLRDTIEARLRSALCAIAAGDDVAPGHLLRLEWLCEAAVMEGASSEEELDSLAETLHEEILGESLTQRLGADWRVYHPFPQLPLYMQRAPVSPSTPA